MRQYDPFDPMRAYYQPSDPMSEVSIYIKLSMPRGTNVDMVAQFIEDLKKCTDTFEYNGIGATMTVDETIAI